MVRRGFWEGIGGGSDWGEEEETEEREEGREEEEEVELELEGSMSSEVDRFESRYIGVD